MKTIMIGAGGIAQPHAKAVNELGITIAGVLDPNPENAGKMAEKYGAKVIGDISEMIDEVDMIHLVTPPSERLQYVRAAAEAGKHIMIEKPIAITVDDAEKIIACVKKHGVKLLVDFNHRFRDGYRLLKEAVDSGRLGNVISVYAQRLGAGAGFYKGWKPGWRTNPGLMCGMSIESVSHDIDMLLQLIPGVESINANLLGTVEELPDFDNNASVTFTTKGGGIGSIYASWTSHLGYSARGVLGSKGSAMLSGDDLWDFNEFTIKTEDMEFPEVTLVGERFATTAYESYLRINRHFKECIERDEEPMITGNDGLRALVFSRAILDSAKAGKAVKVDI